MMPSPSNKSLSSQVQKRKIRLKRSKVKKPKNENPYVTGEPYPNSDPERFFKLLKKESSETKIKPVTTKSKIKISVQRPNANISALTKSSHNIKMVETQDVPDDIVG